MFKHAYILGAGFSYPLGGPLFNDLFSAHRNWQLGATEVDLKQSLSRDFDHITEVRNRFDLIRRNVLSPDSIKNGSNVEQLIEVICDAENTELSTYKAMIESAFSGLVGLSESSKVNKIPMLIKARLALGTYWFPRCIDKDSERWIPYRDWFNKLSS